MKEIFVDVDGELKIANAYKNKLIVSRTEDGYFVESDNEKKGTYFKVFTDSSAQFNYDVFVFGCKADMIEVYRNGLFGLEATKEMDITTHLARTMRDVYGKKQVEKMVAPNFEGCEFLGEAYVYRLSKGGELAHLDGMQRKRVPSIFRYVYKTDDGRIFAINPKAELLPLEKYRKYDSFAELNIAKRQNDGVEYDNIKGDHSIFATPISNIVKKMRNFGLSDEQVLVVLEKLKTVLGIELYRNANKDKIKISAKTNMKLIDLNEVERVLTSGKPIGFYYREWRDCSEGWRKRIAMECELKGIVAKMGYQLKTEGLLLSVEEKNLLIDYRTGEIIQVGKDLFDWSSKTSKQSAHSIVYDEVDVLRMKKPEVYDKFMSIIEKRNETKKVIEEDKDKVM